MNITELKQTKQRKVILEELRKLYSHPTAEELYNIVKLKLPELGLCTIYRNLEKFNEIGLIEKINGKVDRYDGNIQTHNHIKCTVCGKIEDLDFDVPINTEIITKLGYKLSNYKVEINGICKKCQKDKK